MNRWKDWYSQACRDLQKTLLDLENQYYEWACFASEQSAEKVIKAVGLRLGLGLQGSSLVVLLDVLKEHIQIPAEIEERAKLLDFYFLPSQRPDLFASGKPADYFLEKWAKEAVDSAGEILGFCKSCLDQAEKG
ncbi:HEPN domain-containing protein [Bellilinea sp.]